MRPVLKKSSSFIASFDENQKINFKSLTRQNSGAFEDLLPKKPKKEEKEEEQKEELTETESSLPKTGEKRKRDETKGMSLEDSEKKERAEELKKVRVKPEPPADHWVVIKKFSFPVKTNQISQEFRYYRPYYQRVTKTIREEDFLEDLNHITVEEEKEKKEMEEKAKLFVPEKAMVSPEDGFCWFDILPIETIVHIFSYIDTHRDFSCLPQVCFLWSQIASDPFVFDRYCVTLFHSCLPSPVNLHYYWYTYRSCDWTSGIEVYSNLKKNHFEEIGTYEEQEKYYQEHKPNSNQQDDKVRWNKFVEEDKKKKAERGKVCEIDETMWSLLFSNKPTDVQDPELQLFTWVAVLRREGDNNFIEVRFYLNTSLLPYVANYSKGSVIHSLESYKGTPWNEHLFTILDEIDIIDFKKYEDAVEPQSLASLSHVSPPPLIKLKLFSYQLETLGWMMDLEQRVDNEHYWSTPVLVKWPGVEAMDSMLFDCDSKKFYVRDKDDLFSLQKESKIHWTVRGGIVGDEMGLGKTITMLALITSRKWNDTIPRNLEGHKLLKLTDKKVEYHADTLIETNATLIFCPSHLCNQWKEEVEKNVKKNKMKVVVITLIKTLRNLTYQELVDADLVVVSFQFLKNNNYKRHRETSKGEERIVGQEEVSRAGRSGRSLRSRSKAITKWFADEVCLSKKGPVLERFHWFRFVIDEGHELLGDKFYRKAAKMFYSTYRWYMTGTPLPLGFESLAYITEFLKAKRESIPFEIDTNESHGNTDEKGKQIEEGEKLADEKENGEKGGDEKANDKKDDDEKGDEEKGSDTMDVEQDSVQEAPDLKGKGKLDEDVNNEECIADAKIEPDFKPVELLSWHGNSRYQRHRKRLYFNEVLGKSMLEHIYCRHTKQSVVAEYKPPGLLEELVLIEQQGIEKALYTLALWKGDTTRLRQLCCHLQISNKDCNNLGMEEKSLEDIRETMLKLTADRVDRAKNNLKNTKTALKNAEKRLADPSLTQYQKDNRREAIKNHKRNIKLQTKILQKTIEENEEIKAVKPINQKKFALENRYGSKMAALIKYIKALPKDKQIIIFSQWHRMLVRVGETLQEEGVSNVFCKGNIWIRNRAISSFKKQNMNVRVIMLSLENAASGTNLTEASHIIMLDPMATSKKEAIATESQAIGRAHRLGQKKKLTVVRLIMKDTIEHDLYNRNYLRADE